MLKFFIEPPGLSSIFLDIKSTMKNTIKMELR